MENKRKNKIEKTDDIRKVLDDKKINILLLGPSGAGKSELINAYLDTDKESAPVGVGDAVTDKIAVYGDLSGLKYRLIDSPGIEYSKKRQSETAKELKKWLKASVKNMNPAEMIHTIWFCIGGQAKRSPQLILDYLRNVSEFWKDVPIIIVFTQSYFDDDIVENETMIKTAVSAYKKKEQLNIKKVIPVVAREKDQTGKRGLEELEKATLELAPEAMKIFEKNLRSQKCREKRLKAHNIVIASCAAAGTADVVKGEAVSTLLEQIQLEMLHKICDVYEIADESVEKNIVDAILRASVVTSIGKRLAGLVVPATDVKVRVAQKGGKAAIATGITAIVGELGIAVFESVYKGDVDIGNTNWDKYVRKLLDDKRAVNWINSLKKSIKNRNGDEIIDEIKEAEAFFKK